MFAYEQCLLCLAYHPDVWIEAANYLEQSSKILTEKGVSYLIFTKYFSCIGSNKFYQHHRILCPHSKGGFRFALVHLSLHTWLYEQGSLKDS